jgi:hypothetical protein
MSADAGIIIGRISEIMGNKELIIDSLRGVTVRHNIWALVI